MLIKWPEIDWGGSKIQKKKFNSIFLTNESSIDKENSIGGKKKSKIICLWTQLNFI
jgi:hypothetical protein